MTTPIITGGLDKKHTEGRSPLGINTKSSPPAQNLSRIYNFELQSVASQIYASRGKSKGLKYPLNEHKTAACLRVPTGSNVGLNTSLESGRAFYTGLLTCGRVWTCPVCSAKVNQRRREQLKLFFDRAYQNDLKIIMVTITFPHTRNQKLKDLLVSQAHALKLFRKGKTYDRIVNNAQLAGWFRCLEVTRGENGWHPHTHEAWAVCKHTDISILKNNLLKKWENACLKTGLLTKSKLKHFRQHSLHIRDNCSTSDYLAKTQGSNWGADAELTRGAVKSGNKKGFHPYKLLELYLKTNQLKYKNLWLEYSDAIKGKRQLIASRYLLQSLGIDEKTDEQLAKEQTEKSDFLGLLTPEQWKIIRKYDLREKVLAMVETEGYINTVNFITRMYEHEFSSIS